MVRGNEDISDNVSFSVFVFLTFWFIALSDRRPNISFYRNIQLLNAAMCAASFHLVYANILKWMRLSDGLPGFEEQHELVHQMKATSLINIMINRKEISQGLVSASKFKC